MKDRRTVDELSIEELEAILKLRKREARLQRLRQRGLPVPEARPVAAPVQREAAPAEREEAPKAPRTGIQWGWIADKLLLLIEILAVLGLLYILIQLMLTVRELNASAPAAQPLPTLTPTPMINVVVLPGGHTPPDAQGNIAPEPIPPHLQELVAKITPLPVPTPAPQHARRIVIPAIKVDAPVVEGDDAEALKKGAGHHIGSANPGERGNCVISAHNDVYGEIFRDLPSLNVGDEIYVYTENQRYRYRVQEKRIVAPTEVSVMAPTSSPVLTLISCYPYRVNTHRIVVIATLEP